MHGLPRAPLAKKIVIHVSCGAMRTARQATAGVANATATPHAAVSHAATGIGDTGAMPSVSPFRLIHSNALEVLAGVLAHQLRTPVGDWLQPEVVLVPQRGMQRWLQQTLAQHGGICANLRFLTPGEFVEQALDANLGPAPVAERLRPEVLRWQLLQRLHDAPPPAYATLLQTPAAQEDDGRRAWSLACALADTFETYQAWRHGLLLQWEAGQAPEDPQAQLWRAVARGKAHRARRIGQYLQRFSGGADGVPQGLPPRLSVFACQNVSPDVLQVIVSQARAGEQHVYLHTPSRRFWGDLQRWADRYRPAHDHDFVGGHADAPPNPLLASWGQAGRDVIAVMGSGELSRAEEVSIDAFDHGDALPATGRSLLRQLQLDILDNLAPGHAGSPPDWPRPAVRRDDASLQFHACHTPLREVQVLHDQLRALLDADPVDGAAPLQLRDIAVLAPDIDRYLPHIQAVFGSALGTARAIPFSVADAGALAASPLVEAFVRLLWLAEEPITLPGLIDLLAVPALAAQMDIDAASAGRLQDWLNAAGARWGLDADDRAAHGGDGIAYSLQFAIERLLLGHACGAPAQIGDVAALPMLDGQATAQLDGLLRLLDVLRQAAALHGQATPQEWSQRLDALLTAAFGEEPQTAADRHWLQQLRGRVAAIGASAEQAGFATPVAFALIRQQLLDGLQQGDAQAPLLAGAVSFGRMVPMRLIPFRVICLLGLDAGAFPGQDGHDPLNRIAQQLDTPQRRVGDPSRRDADRFLMLQLLVSAGHTFYMSWIGQDPRDGTACEPSPLVSELLQVAGRYHVDPAAAGALVVRHALQPYSPQAFGAAWPDEAEADPRRFSGDGRWQDSVHAEAASRPAAPFVPHGLLPSPPATLPAPLTLQVLQRTLRQPQQAFLRHGLGLHLAEAATALADSEPLGQAHGLRDWQLRQAVFQTWLQAGRPPQAEPLRQRLLAQALLPPGEDGRAGLQLLLARLAPFAELALQAGWDDVPCSIGGELDWDDARLQLTLQPLHARGLLQAVLRDNGLDGRHHLRHGLEALAAAALELPVWRLAVPEPGQPPQLLPLALPDARQARAVLRSLMRLHEAALREPLPFLPDAGYAWVCAGDAQRGLQQARSRWLGSAHGHGQADAATALALRGRDPFVDGDAVQQQRFAGLAQAIFDAVLQFRPIAAEWWA